MSLQRGILEGRRVLVMEDEFLIAMDVEELCRDHGAAEVTIVCDIAEAGTSARAIGSFDVAIVDARFCLRSSMSVAQRLRDARVPFVLASGYDDADEVMTKFAGIPIVAKPCHGAELISAVEAAMGDHR